MKRRLDVILERSRDAWAGRTRTLHGDELREYNEFWRDWHMKYDGYRTRDGKHRINGTGHQFFTCICGTEYYGAPEDQLLEAFQEHLDAHQPPRIKVGSR